MAAVKYEVQPVPEMLLTVEEAADVLKTNPAMIYKLKNSGLLKVLKLGRYKIRVSEIQRFLEASEGYDLSDPENPKII